jgi:hypothetical protein
VLRTARDYADLVEWNALRPTRKALRTNSRGALPNLARAVVAEALRRPLRERKTYREIAEILARGSGHFVTEEQIKDIRVGICSMDGRLNPLALFCRLLQIRLISASVLTSHGNSV